MTDHPPTPDRADDHARLMQRLAQKQARRVALRDLNKAVLFDALDQAGIARVLVDFDGYGDSGQIEDMEVQGGDGTPIPWPEARLFYTDEDADDGVAGADRTVREVVEALVYDCLDETHPGWENDDGADGRFTFEAATRVILLEHNERYTESTAYEHAF